MIITTDLLSCSDRQIGWQVFSSKTQAGPNRENHQVRRCPSEIWQQSNRDPPNPVRFLKVTPYVTLFYTHTHICNYRILI